MSSKDLPLINRELSWLSFNERVLQEAEDPSVPLIERLRFVGIYSNNRDEFFRVRVATLRRMSNLGKKDQKLLLEDPKLTLSKIQKVGAQHEKKFQKIYAKLLDLLGEQKIYIIDETQLDEPQKQYLVNFFREEVRPALVPIMLRDKNNFPFLKDGASYLSIKLWNTKIKKDCEYAIIEIPTNIISRFLVLPSREQKKYVILQDDVIRYCLKEIFPIYDYEKIEAFSIKVTRDAELDVEDDISLSVIDKLTKSLKDRVSGDPVRFIYDKNIPDDLLDFILLRMDLKKGNNLIASSKYHNFRDFISFPSLGQTKLINPPIENAAHPYLKNVKSYLQTIDKKDIFLYYPYHSFNYVIDILREAAIDPDVISIKINLYRVAKKSKVINALINAAKNGKSVTVVVELQARFDEEANINWAENLQAEGVKVIFGMQGLKVHAKLILISKRKNKKIVKYAHIGSGNFNESTAKMYTDVSIFTANQSIANEVDKIFDFFENPYKVKRYSTLIVSPFTTRRKFLSFIDKEIENAKKGKDSYIILKLNNLVDPEMISKLYEASTKGVKIYLIIRGICSLVPGVKGLSERIEVTSIVDRFLEHARIAVFCNAGSEKYFISSADWMGRNLDRRIEVTTPILDKNIQKILQTVIQLQLTDNVKARIIDREQKNEYVENSTYQIRSQIKIQEYLSELGKKDKI